MGEKKMGGYWEAEVSSMQGGKEWNSSTEMHKNMNVERGVPEQQATKHEWGNGTQEATHKVTELINLGVFVYRIKCKKTTGWKENENVCKDDR
jgi:hypothetical protein